MSNSPLVVYTKLSPNYTKSRNHKIDTITIHCMAGNLSVESCGNVFTSPSRKASSNYGIGSDGRIALYVDESNRSWCTSSTTNDNRAVTIEVANIENKEPWSVSDKAMEALIKLCADICKRNNINKLLWKGDKNLIGQVDKQNMTVHRWFAPKSCPGNYLYNHHSFISDEVNKLLSEKSNELFGEEEEMTVEQFEILYKEMLAKNRGDNPSSWAKEACDLAKKAGVFNGDGNGNFDWQEPITREAVAVVLKNVKLI